MDKTSLSHSTKNLQEKFLNLDSYMHWGGGVYAPPPPAVVFYPLLKKSKGNP